MSVLPVKNINVRLPDNLHQGLSDVARDTRISINNIILMACEAVLGMIDKEGAVEQPKIVELARAARRHQDPISKLQAETARWEMGREEILRTAESPAVTPEFRKLLHKMDAAAKEARKLLKSKGEKK